MLYTKRIGKTVTEMLDKCLGIEDVDYDKLKATHDLDPGDQIEIEWKPYPGEEDLFEPLIDRGYVFVFPGSDPELELMVHVPHPSGGEKCEPDPVWSSLAELLNNPMVAEIRRPKNIT